MDNYNFFYTEHLKKTKKITNLPLEIMPSSRMDAAFLIEEGFTVIDFPDPVWNMETPTTEALSHGNAKPVKMHCNKISVCNKLKTGVKSEIK